MTEDIQPRPSAGVGPLDGRVALVTGASSGIGLEVARAFLAAGARVHGVARRADAMAAGVGGGPGFTAHAADVVDAPAVERLVSGIGETEGVDLLVCAAGTNVPERRLGQLTPESWDTLLAVNLSGAFYFVRATLPYLRRSRGCAMLIASVSASWPDASGPAYQASKAGMLALARAAGLEEHERGVRFSAILPGMVDTPILDRRPTPPAAEARAQALRPEDVAAACLFLATLPERAYVPELTLLPTALQALGGT
jgi:NAD(P)-dependent dehydrogenase (short-subunit alcohol dehydrogenase family)